MRSRIRTPRTRRCGTGRGTGIAGLGAAVKEGKTTPPKHFTEDTLLSAMETAGKDDMPEDAERKGLGTPATRAGILEKLVPPAFWSAKRARKPCSSLPSHDAVSLITVLPEQLQSPLLTAEWEYRWVRSSVASWPRRISWLGLVPCSKNLWEPIKLSRERSICSALPTKWWANAPAVAERLQKCKKASSVRQNLANLQFGKTTSGGR